MAYAAVGRETNGFVYSWLAPCFGYADIGRWVRVWVESADFAGYNGDVAKIFKTLPGKWTGR